MIVTVLAETGQDPLRMVHLKTYVPGIIPVTALLLTDGFEIKGVLGPLTQVHVPRPAVGTFPASVVVVTLQRLCAGPALEVVGVRLLTMLTWLDEGLHIPLLMVH